MLVPVGLILIAASLVCMYYANLCWKYGKHRAGRILNNVGFVLAVASAVVGVLT